MSLQEAFERIKKRKTPLDVFRLALTAKGLPAPGRWQAVIDGLTEKKGPAINAIDRENKLKEIYKELIKFGDKAIQIADFDESSAHLFESIHQSNFKLEHKPDEYFHDISDENLRALPTRPSLAKVESNSTGLVKTLYFLSQEIRRTREDIAFQKEFEKLPALKGYANIYGVREENFLRVDLVVIDIKKRRFEFRVDCAGTSSQEVMRDYLGELKKHFRNALSENVGEDWKTLEFPLRNLYPRIDTLYNEKSDGEVSAIGYNTPYGARNMGVMRGTGDLKEDPSHEASMNASETEIYYITKSYELSDSPHRIKLTIPGKTSEVGVPEPKMFTAIIEDCFNEQQYLRMSAKLK